MKKTLFLLSLGLLLILPTTVKAQPIAPQPCDTNFWNQMKSRAWMEAEREIMQNQNLIFKPDSVLEYTCFDQFAAINAWQGGDIFVHTDYFGAPVITRGSDHSMEKAMDKVVYGALEAYRNLNFDTEYLSARAKDIGVDKNNKNSKTNADGDHFKSIESQGTTPSYTCSTMQDIWQAAKCANFIDNDKVKDSDGFYPFETLTPLGGGDPITGYDTIKDTRAWPSPCNTSVGITTWDKEIKFAENKGDALYPFEDPLQKIYQDVGDRLKPNGCTGGAGIKTGVEVITTNGKHDDGVCTNPGCVYTKLGTCVQSGGSGPISPGP